MALKTDYKDDVLDLTQNANRKYEEIENQDGSISFNDVTVYEETGDTFGAADANAITRALTDTTRNISFQFGIDTNGDYGYIKDGETEVTPFKSRHTETYKPTVRANNNDMGLYHNKRYVDTTAVPNSNTGTYTASSRGAALDMGATNTYRYVNTNSVPNSNSGTYPNNTGITANGTYDMGATNTYRYVKVNVSDSTHQCTPYLLITQDTYRHCIVGLIVDGVSVGAIEVGTYGSQTNGQYNGATYTV